MLSITVNTLVDENDGADVGNISLRDAIALAATQSGFDVIDFDPSLADGVIELEHGQLEIDSDLAIHGLGMNSLTIDALGDSRVFLIDADVTASIYGLTITGGTAALGGGVYTSGNLALDSVRVSGNSATSRGGGIYVYDTLTLRDSIVADNQAAYDGGGIFIADVSSATILRSTIDGNEALFGAGIAGFLHSGQRLVIEASTISRNGLDDAIIGGGLLLQSASSTDPSVVTITNSTISGNAATYSAGIRADGAKVQLNMVNSTLAYNECSSSEGGGVQASGATVLLHNTIIAENENSGGKSDLLNWGGTIDSASSHNLFGSGGSGGLTHGTNHNIVLASLQSAGLLPLGDYGGPTRTHALMVGSPALDAGNDDLALGFDDEPLQFDQRGHRRPFDLPDVANFDGNIVDIGAYEAGNPADLYVRVPDDELDDINDPDFNDEDMSIREALAIAKVGSGSYRIHFEPYFLSYFFTLSMEEELVIDKDDDGSITIIGNEYPNSIWINANGESRVFRVTEGTTANLIGLTITGGDAETGYGGGILSYGDLTLVGVDIHGNEAQLGAGIYQDGGSLSIAGSSVSENIAPGTYSAAGGIFIRDANHLTIDSTAILRNAGGGMSIIETDSDITSTTISSNYGAVAGGGIFFWTPSVRTHNLTNVTITENSAYQGGGVFRDNDAGAEVILKNCIVIANIGTYIDNNFFAEIDGASSNNLLFEGDSGGLTSTSNILISANDIESAGLAPLGNYGGPTESYMLLPTSIAIDAGDDTAATDLVFDQIGDGFRRKLGNHVDIGASEAHVILRGDGTLEVYGTDLDDNIEIREESVWLDKIGEITVDVNGTTEVKIDTSGGVNIVHLSVETKSKVNPLNIPGMDGPELVFDPGRISFQDFINPNQSLVSATDEWLSTTIDAGWRTFLSNFLDDPEAIGPRWLNTKLAIVQIAKCELEGSGWYGIEQWLELLYNYDWRIDTKSERTLPPNPAQLVYPLQSGLQRGGTVVDFTKTPSGYLSMVDSPGLEGYTFTSGAYRTEHLRQEFETYVIGLEGQNGIQFDRYIVDTEQPGRAIYQGVKKVTVYGGIKWYHDFVYNPANSTYAATFDVTDVVGTPTENFAFALSQYLDGYFPIHE